MLLFCKSLCQFFGVVLIRLFICEIMYECAILLLCIYSGSGVRVGLMQPTGAECVLVVIRDW